MDGRQPGAPGGGGGGAAASDGAGGDWTAVSGPAASSFFTPHSGGNGAADDADVAASVDRKAAFVCPTEDEFLQLQERLSERLACGETMLELGCGEGEPPGLSADDLAASVATLHSLASLLDAECVELRRRETPGGYVVEYLVRRHTNSEDFMEVRVAVVGNVDAGKSTLLGVLTHGELDNGRGLARQRLFRHKHEAESGRTSSVGNDILGFDTSGNVVNKPVHGNLDWTRICEESSKVITFIDLAGHEKYLKTTVFGMTGHQPDFCMLMVGSNMGVVGMTKEHLGLALALNVPVFVVVTKIDMCPPNVLAETLKVLQRVLKSPGCRKLPVLVQNKDDVICCAMNFTSERMCPIFQVSNVTGDNLDLLKQFLNLLQSRWAGSESEPAEFQIDSTFSVPGVGTVVSGTMMAGVLKLNQTMLLGPNHAGEFIPVPIRSIHRKRLPVREVRGGQTASFALKKIKRNSIRKGMVLVAPERQPEACWEFDGEILVLHHPTTISCRYQAVVHVGSVRQTASILTMSQEHLRTGDKALCRFRFIKYPEYIRTNIRMVFREGRTKAVGTVVKVFPLHSTPLVISESKTAVAVVTPSGAASAAAPAAAQQTSRPPGQGQGSRRGGIESAADTTSAAGGTTTDPDGRTSGKRNRRGKRHTQGVNRAGLSANGDLAMPMHVDSAECSPLS